MLLRLVGAEQHVHGKLEPSQSDRVDQSPLSGIWECQVLQFDILTLSRRIRLSSFFLHALNIILTFDASDLSFEYWSP